MAARRVQHDGLTMRLAIHPHRVKAHALTIRHNILGAHLGVGRKAVSGHRALHLRQDAAHIGVVHAQYGMAIKWQPMQKIDKSLLKFFQAVVVSIHMVGVDVGHHGHHRLQTQKRSIRLIRFGHQEIALAQPGVGTGGLQPAADDKGRIQAGGAQHRGHQTGGGGFAMGAGNGDALLETHQLGQHHGARHHRNARGLGSQHFRVVGFHRRGCHHHIRAGNISGIMPKIHFCPGVDQTARGGAVGHVRAGHGVTQGQQDLGDTAHADAADADKVNMLDSMFHRSMRSSRPASGATSKSLLLCRKAGLAVHIYIVCHGASSAHTSATLLAASVKAMRRAACAISRQRSRVSAASQSAKASAFSSPCGHSRAAPASAR